jgi:hypothetical protein
MKTLPEIIPELTFNQDATAEVNAAEFNTYREFIDQATTGVRKEGIFEEPYYADALKDDSTVVIETEGVRFPILSLLKYVPGYDIKRCVELAEVESDSQLYYLNLNSNLFMSRKEEISSLLRSSISSNMVIFYDVPSEDELAQSNYDEALASTGLMSQEIPLVAPTIEKPESKQATLSLFYTDVIPLHPAYPVDTKSNIYTKFVEAVQEGEVELLPENGTTILSGNNIGEDLFQEMWEVYKDKFQWLGQGHPISMEDTIDEFRTLLQDPATFSSILFKDSKPVCFAYFFSDLSRTNWLKPDYLKQVVGDIDHYLFFGGIVSSSEGMGMYSSRVIKSIVKFGTRIKAPHRIIFESTNVSEQYIPQLVYKYINETTDEYDMYCTKATNTSEREYKAVSYEAY